MSIKRARLAAVGFVILAMLTSPAWHARRRSRCSARTASRR